MMGTSTRDIFLTPLSALLPLKCLLPPLFFFLTVIFLAESELIRGGERFLGLWMVKGSSSSDFLFRRKSKSLSYKFVGDDTGEFRGVADTIGSLPFADGIMLFLGEGDDDEINMVWEPTVKSLKG